jgi:hypothetical protein
MSIEVTVALIGAGSALLGAAIGTIASIWTTKTQLQASNKQLEIEQLRRKEALLENFLHRWNAMAKVDATGTTNIDQIVSRFTDRFLDRVQLFLSVAHHFPRDHEEKITTLSDEINGYILKAKTGGTVDGQTAKDAVERMQNLEKETAKIAGERLRWIQSDIANLLPKKRSANKAVEDNSVTRSALHCVPHFDVLEYEKNPHKQNFSADLWSSHRSIYRR